MKLSILIPARNEMFIGRTIADILEHVEGETEVIAVLDGYTEPIPEIPKDPRVKVVMLAESIGQRAATNLACRMSTAKYVAKVDAHCSFDQGFDVKLMADMQDDWTVVPTMRNLHAFDWVCPDGHRRYQSPSGPCKDCGKETVRDVVWIAKASPQSTAYCFDPEPHFQYHNEYKRKQQGDLVETMSLQGSFFMLTREKYWELNICDESFGSWGSQGIEVAVKTWLSGGRVICNKKTWYAHMFRTQGGDFGFPYELSGQQVSHAKRTARDLFFNNKWDKQIRPLSWLVEKFWPVPKWTEKDLNDLKGTKPTVGVLYYTDNELDSKIMTNCQQQLKDAAGDKPIVSVSLKPIDFGKNIVLSLERSILTMTKQILAGLEALDTDIVFFAEHDVLYPKEHFDFMPPQRDVFYYNGNYWFVRADGFAVHYNVSPLSGLVAYRNILIAHYKERIDLIERIGYSRWIGYEPMTHNRVAWENKYPFEVFTPSKPIIDISHGKNVSRKRWSQDKFIRKPKFWEEGTASNIPGWGDVTHLISGA